MEKEKICTQNQNLQHQTLSIQSRHGSISVEPRRRRDHQRRALPR